MRTGARECASLRAMLLEAAGLDQNDSSDSCLEAGHHAGAYLPTFWPILARHNRTFMFIDLGDGELSGCIREWAREDFDRPVQWRDTAHLVAETRRSASAGEECSVADGELVW